MSTQTIVVAGASGRLGLLVCAKILTETRANVKALVRSPKNNDLQKLVDAHKNRIEIHSVDYSSGKDLSTVCKNAFTVVSCLVGLEPIIVGVQLNLLKSAIECKVRRFIPSDFSLNFTKIPDGSNRNLDNRKKFHIEARKLISQTGGSNSIEITSIFQGGFTDNLVLFGTIDYKSKKINYFGDYETKVDMTTWSDTAHYTALVAVDPNPTPSALCIAGQQPSPKEILEITKRITGAPFTANRVMPLWALNGIVIPMVKILFPGKPDDLYPLWQGMQYVNNQATGLCLHKNLDNNRYKMNWENIAPTILQGYQDYQRSVEKNAVLAKKSKRPSALLFTIALLVVLVAIIVLRVK